MSDRNRVLITGVGVVSPFGNRESFWQKLLKGQTATRRLEISEKDRHLWISNAAGAPAVPNATLSRSLTDLERVDLLPFMDEPVIAHALTAAMEAVEDAGLGWSATGSSISGRSNVGCVIGSSKGGVLTQQLACEAKWTSLAFTGDVSISPEHFWTAFSPHGAAQAVSSLFALQGPQLAPVAACATGLASLVRAAMLIESGECDVVLAGSSDASLSPSIVATFRRLGVLSRRGDHPESAIRPFDRDRDGFLIGEGAAVIVLESEQHARNRNTQPYAEWLAGGSVADTHAMTKLADDPQALCWLIADVLNRSSLNPGDLDYISLHGTATRMNDACEIDALRSSLGPAAKDVSASSLKGAIGHLLGAAGSVEFAATLLAMRDSQLPPTANLQTPDDGVEFDLIHTRARQRDVQYAMKLSLGFGGHLFAAIVKRPGL